MPNAQRHGMMPPRRNFAMAPIDGLSAGSPPKMPTPRHPLELHDPLNGSRGGRSKHKRFESGGATPRNGAAGGLTPLGHGGVGSRMKISASDILEMNALPQPVPPSGPKPMRLQGVGRKTTHVAALDVVDGIAPAHNEGLRQSLKVSPRQRDIMPMAIEGAPRRAGVKAPPSTLWKPGQDAPVPRTPVMQMGKYKALPGLSAAGSLGAAGKQPSGEGETLGQEVASFSPYDDLDEMGYERHSAVEGPRPPPGQCSGCHAMLTGTGEAQQICVFWLDPEEGGKAAWYDVQLSLRGGDDWLGLDPSQVAVCGPGCADINGLSEEVFQRWHDGDGMLRIRACNQAGHGPWSEPST